jgi:hypothetical protein
MSLRIGESPKDVRRSAAETAVGDPLRLISVGRIIAGLVIIAWLCDRLVAPRPSDFLASYHFRGHDLYWSLIVAGVLALARFIGAPRSLRSIGGDLGWRESHWASVYLALLTLIICVAGTHLVFHGYHQSRDEILAEFDAITFRSGEAIAFPAVEWISFVRGAAPHAMFPVPNWTGFMSGYLPGHALLRAFVGLFVDPNLTSPLLAALSVGAVWGVARKLWPARPEAAFIVALLVATSAQTLIMGMTSFAMSAHLALNMVWLWLFLRNDRTGHAGAVAVGALACGLHQVAFHPLFVAPFIFRLWWTRKVALTLYYVVAYGLIILFWIDYGKIVIGYYGLQGDGVDRGGQYFLYRVIGTISDQDWRSVVYSIFNLLRFIVWQNPALLPLLWLAWRPLRVGAGYSRELAWGVALTFGLCLIVMPYQGNGWGYRYLHGLIGSLALLGCYGWIELVDRLKKEDVAPSRAILLTTSVFAFFVLLPAHAMSAHRYVDSYFEANAALQRAETDVVVIDPVGLCGASELVRNDPFLRNRPKLLELKHLRPQDADELCRRFTVSVFDSTSMPLREPLKCAASIADPPARTPRIPCAVPFGTKAR